MGFLSRIRAEVRAETPSVGKGRHMTNFPAPYRHPRGLMRAFHIIFFYYILLQS